MLLVLCDFDDTAAECNAAQFVLERFAGPESDEHRALYRAGGLSFRDYQERMFNTVTATLGEMQAYAREHVALRPGLREAVEATRAAGGEFWIASAGIDFYIAPVLDAHGLGDVPILSVLGSATGELPPLAIRYDYPASQEHCRDWAVCKCEPIAAAREAGNHVMFIGDGLRSDTCAAARADTVFARARLLAHCRENGIDAIELEDFFQVASHIERMTALRSG